MLTIGLTGAIGSGKSTVASILEGLGAPIIDADKIGHAMYEPGGPAYDAMVEVFGRDIVGADGRIDRRRLGAIVFSNLKELRKLETIVHPRMTERMREMVAEMRTHGERRPIVIEAAILIEAAWDALCDEVWMVVAPRQSVVERLARQRTIDPKRVEAMLGMQLSDEERRQHATRVIENTGTIAELSEKVAALWREALARNG